MQGRRGTAVDAATAVGEGKLGAWWSRNGRERRLPVCLFAKSSLVNLYLEIDGESKGFRQLKCESKTHELDSLLATLCDPMEFLCQTMAISPYCKDQLDETLTSNLMANIPKHGFPLLSFSSDPLSSKLF